MLMVTVLDPFGVRVNSNGVLEGCAQLVTEIEALLGFDLVLATTFLS